VPSQFRAAQLDGSNEAVARTAVLDRGNHCCNGLRPHIGLHLGIDSAVGDDLGIALSDGRENQLPSSVLGEVDASGQKLRHRFGVRAPHSRRFGTMRKRIIDSDRTSAATMNAAS
jgi:hypothetical protein